MRWGYEAKVWQEVNEGGYQYVIASCLVYHWASILQSVDAIIPLIVCYCSRGMSRREASEYACPRV